MTPAERLAGLHTSVFAAIQSIRGGLSLSALSSTETAVVSRQASASSVGCSLSIQRQCSGAGADNGGCQCAKCSQTGEASLYALAFSRRPATRYFLRLL